MFSAHPQSSRRRYTDPSSRTRGHAAARSAGGPAVSTAHAQGSLHRETCGRSESANQQLLLSTDDCQHSPATDLIEHPRQLLVAGQHGGDQISDGLFMCRAKAEFCSSPVSTAHELVREDKGYNTSTSSAHLQQPAIVLTFPRGWLVLTLVVQGAVLQCGPSWMVNGDPNPQRTISLLTMCVTLSSTRTAKGSREYTPAELGRMNPARSMSL